MVYQKADPPGQFLGLEEVALKAKEGMRNGKIKFAKESFKKGGLAQRRKIPNQP